MDMSATIENTTTDLGKLPQSFGVQTDNFSLLGDVLAIHDSLPAVLQVAHGPQPRQHELAECPLRPEDHGVSRSRICLSSARRSTRWSPSRHTTLPVSPARRCGRRTAVPAPLVAGPGSRDALWPQSRHCGHATLSNFYPGATFHKPRVGSGSATQLRVPDSSDTNPLPLSSVPVGRPGFAALPFVGLAVPLGTPVGTYAQNLRLYEGMDTDNYPNINGSTAYKPFLPPQYGHQVINPTNTNAPTTAGAHAGEPQRLMDARNGVPQQPYTTPTVIQGHGDGSAHDRRLIYRRAAADRCH